MYADVTTWNPFKGCRFDCAYCSPSFQRQAKRQKHNCRDCYDYAPHCHPERLAKIPAGPVVFVAGNGDLAFCPPDFMRAILSRIRDHNRKRPDKTYYLQSKRPVYFRQFLTELPPNVILLTTLETNRDAGYAAVSQAPPPTVRYRQFAELDYPRKVLTIEPLMDFDLPVLSWWIIKLWPEYVWLGLNSHPQTVALPEPATEKVRRLMVHLAAAGIEVRAKDLRAMATGIPNPEA
jgi:hypothetical protein